MLHTLLQTKPDAINSQQKLSVELSNKVLAEHTI